MKQQDAIKQGMFRELLHLGIINMVAKINILIDGLEETPKVISRKQDRVQQNRKQRKDEESITAKNLLEVPERENSREEIIK